LISLGGEVLAEPPGVKHLEVLAENLGGRRSLLAETGVDFPRSAQRRLARVAGKNVVDGGGR
jgi:hypothetical protein